MSKYSNCGLMNQPLSENMR